MKQISLLISAMSALCIAEPVSLEQRVQELECDLHAVLDRATFLSDAANEKRCHDYTLSFDILYWHPKTDYTDFGVSTNNTAANDGNPYDGMNTHYLGYDWSFGFKAGIGYQFSRTLLKLDVEYTRVQFRDSELKNILISNVGYTYGNSSSLTNPFDAKFSQPIDYQTITVLLDRQFYLNRFLALQPSVGAKTFWINQSPTLYPNNEGNLQSSEKTLGIGPMGAVLTHWLLCNGWAISAESGLALCFTRYRGHVDDGTLATAPASTNKESKHYVVPNLFLSIGLNYALCFEEEKRHVDLFLGYESQFYVQQSFAMQNFMVSSRYVKQGALMPRNLSVYGLTAKASCSF